MYVYNIHSKEYTWLNMLMFADCDSMRLCEDVNDDVAVTIQIVRTEEFWTGSNLPTHSGLTNHWLATSLL